jgi:hypothetical protein
MVDAHSDSLTPAVVHQEAWIRKHIG